MFAEKLKKHGEAQWVIEPFGKMRVPIIVFADEGLIRDMDEQVYQQAANVAALPGIVKASYAMPDAHWGYGFPIGGVGAFDPDNGGIISAGGVGFDISCGVRSLHTGLTFDQIKGNEKELADVLARRIPAGVGSEGKFRVTSLEMDDMLQGGALWAVEQGYGQRSDLRRIEENGRMLGAEPRYVSDHAKQRQEKEVGTLGSGNHYLEVQRVAAVYSDELAKAFGIALNDIMVMIHCGSRGLGHQIATDYLAKMIKTAREEGIELADKDLACAPIKSEVGKQYYGAMCAGINCALANRQVLTHLTRQAFAGPLPASQSDAGLRCLAQYLQGGRARDRRAEEEAVRAPQGRNAGVRAGTPLAAGGSAGDRPAGPDRRHDGDRLVHSGRHARKA